MLEDVKARHCILFVGLEELGTEELFQKLLEMHIDELASPLAASRRRKQLLAQESFVRVASQLMDSDINGTTTAVKHHDYAVLNHLRLDLWLTVLATLNTGALRLQTQQQIA